MPSCALLLALAALQSTPPSTASVPQGSPVAPAHVVEAALLCSGRTLSLSELTTLFDGTLTAGDVQAVVHTLAAQWMAEGRGFELAGDAHGWRVQARREMAESLGRMESRQAHRYSSAVLETLAVIAYLQPVTRTRIEEQRKRAVTPGVMQQLEERGWIEVIGHQESPGRPALYATTFKFLDDLGLESIADLPPLEDLSLAVAEPSQVAAAEPVLPDPDDPWEGEDPRIHPTGTPESAQDAAAALKAPGGEEAGPQEGTSADP